jgi:hypothetical protein
MQTMSAGGGRAGSSQFQSLAVDNNLVCIDLLATRAVGQLTGIQ